MRTLGVGNSAQPTSTLRDFTDAVKIEVANASDVLTDLTSNAVSLEYEQTTDEIVDAATVVFRWQSGANSYAPLMTASPPVAVGRRIVISINPGSGTFKEVFRGKIDDVKWPERFGDVTVTCRDQAGVAADTWIENAIQYSTTTGVALETVMQEVADDNLTTSHTLNFPGGATGAVVQHVVGDPPYGPSEQSTLDALRALAESIGMTIRWRHFDASASDWKWTVFTPSRTKTAPDHTFAATDYWDVTQMEQSIEDIRNVVEVEFTQSGGSRARVTVTDAVSTGGAMTATSTTLTTTGGNAFAATDVGKTIVVPGAGAAGADLRTTIATRVSGTEVTLAVAASTTVSGKEVVWGSIADYGRRYIKISEASDSPINRLELATQLANAALSDLKDPDALLEIECRYFWPGEVGVDLYRFSANNKHFSGNQDLAAMSFRHRIAVGERPTTWILTRGKPSGGVLMWKRRIGNTLPTTVATDIAVTNFREVERGQTTVTIGWDVSGDIDEIWVWYSTPAQPLASDPWASFTGAPTVRLTADSESYAIAIPDYGAVTYVQIIPIGVRANVVVRGNPARLTVQGEQVRLVQSAEITATSSTQCTVRVRVANPIAGGDITVTPTAVGCTISPTGAQTIATASQTAVLSTTGYVDYTVTRPAFQAGSGRVTFVASATDRLQDTDSVDIPAQERDTVELAVRASVQTRSATQWVVRVFVADPVTGGSGNVSVAYAAVGATVAEASPQSIASASVTTSLDTTGYAEFTVTRPAFQTGDGRVTFTATRTGRAAGIDAIDVSAQERDTVELLCRAKVQSTSATQVVFRVAVADYVSGGSGDVTLTYTATGCTVNTPASPQTIVSASITADIDTTGTKDITIDRAAFGAGMGRVTFTATRSGRVPATDSGDVPSLDRDTQPVQVRITRVSETTTQNVVRVAAITPNAGATCTVTYDAGGLTVSPASGAGTFTSTTSFGTTNYIDYTITRPSRGAKPSRVAFTVSASGFVDGTDSVDAQPVGIPMACRLSVADVGTYTDDTWITLAWSGGGVELEDTDGLHSTVTNNSRITIPTGGSKGRWYIGAGGVFTSLAGTLVHVRIRLMKNGVEIGGAWDAKVAAAVGSDVYTGFLRVQRLLTVADGDYFEVQVLQKTGANNGSFDNAYFEAVQLIGE